MKNLKLILLVLTIAALVFSYIGAKEPFTWWLEVAPVFLGLFFLIIFRKFKFTNLIYVVIFLHFLVLIIGGHYTYAEVPGFDWMNKILGGTRNNYDKIGHFMQGFSPALIVREIFIRKNVVNGKKWLFFLVLCFVMFVSSTYELIEWLVSVSTGDKGDSFLGTQGYIWDTQTDMLMALIGGVVAQVFLANYQDFLIKKNNS